MSFLTHLGVMRVTFDDDKAAPIMRAAPPVDVVDKAAENAVGCECLLAAADGDFLASLILAFFFTT